MGHLEQSYNHLRSILWQGFSFTRVK